MIPDEGGERTHILIMFSIHLRVCLENLKLSSRTSFKTSINALRVIHLAHKLLTGRSTLMLTNGMLFLYPMSSCLLMPPTL